MSDMDTDRSLELYIHIPFCVRKCLYCDFYSAPGTEEAQLSFFRRLFEEIGETPFTGRVTSVFFGGGTPSIANAHLIAETLERLKIAFRFEADAEITIEANPGTVTPEKLRVYRACGINRISIGMQSADDAMLRRIGRIHTFSEVQETVRMAREAGFENLNLDLISGLPGETPASFEKTLFSALSLDPEHLSVYGLTIAENTPFHRLYGDPDAGEEDDLHSEESSKRGTDILPLPNEDADREMIHRANRILKDAGYRHYEISNYAKEGHECRHNLGYWNLTDYLGFGPSAASLMEGKRFRNRPVSDWNDRTYDETETLTEEDRMAEYMILGLRTADGVDERIFKERFEVSMISRYLPVLEPYIRAGKVLRKQDGFCLTEDGIDISNRIFADLL